MSTDLNADHRDAAAPPALRCEGLRKAFGRALAVHDVSLSVRQGEILALLGPSGVGKTTCLRLIAGFETPDAGRVAINDREVVGPGAFVPPEHRRVGMVFQDYALFPHLSVAANVRYGLDAAGAPRGDRRLRRWLHAARNRLPGGARAAAADARVAEVLHLVALSRLADRYPHELSGGEAQRVALARALAPGPALILLDEPFSNLDSRLRAAVRSEVRDILKRAGAAAVFVTHDQEEAFTLADRVAVMWDGRIAQVGPPEEIYHHPATRAVAAFVGDADFLPGRLQRDRVETEIGLLPINHRRGVHDTSTGQPAVQAMIRPEQVRLLAAPDGPATVVKRDYFGHDQLVTVRLPSGALLRARLGPEEDFRVGGRVRVSACGGAVLFPPTDA